VRHPVARAIITLSFVTVPLVACSSDDGGNSAASGSTTADSSLIAGSTLAPTTTFIPDCGQMPTAADVSAAVGVPVADGEVVGSGTCQFLGVNDQSKSVLLSLFNDPADQASFNDLQTSLGAPTPYTDPALPGAQVGVDSTLFVTANGAIYTVLTNVTDASTAEQVPLSAAVLTKWLTL
jgi:hypothetical protein